MLSPELNSLTFEEIVKTPGVLLSIYGIAVLWITVIRAKYSFINHTDNEDLECLSVKIDLHSRVVDVFLNRDIEMGEEMLSVYNLDKHIDILGGFERNIYSH